MYAVLALKGFFPKEWMKKYYQDGGILSGISRRQLLGLKVGQALMDAIETEKEILFKEVYDQMKNQYDITIDFNYWGSIVIGLL